MTSSKEKQKAAKEYEEAREKMIIAANKLHPPTEREINQSFEEFANSLPGKILTDPNLFERLNSEFDKSVVGEYGTRMTLLLIALGGKLTINAEPTSKNLMVNDESGAGKDYITRQVLKLLPSEDVVVRKRITQKVFCYWHNAKFEPDWSWDGKVFYGEDVSNSILNSNVFKVFSSSEGESRSTVVINQAVFDIITRGKPVMILTIASAFPKHELLRRYPSCTLNTTEKQTKLILQRKAKFHEKGIRPSYDPNLIKAISRLKRVKVRVPFASKLVNILSTKHLTIRTSFDRFVDYIKFSTSIHQYQRKVDTEGYILATPQDYEIGRVALIKTTSNVFSITLTKNQQKILAVFGELDSGLSYSVSDLEPKVTFCSDRTLRTELDKLTNFGFLFKDREERAESKKPVMTYRFLVQPKINIPSWKEIQNNSNVTTASNASIVSNASNDGTNERNETNEANPQGTETQKTPESFVTESEPVK